MTSLNLQIYLSYSQLCIFLGSFAQPFNDWSDRNFSQGFSWRQGSVSFRALVEDGNHKINLFINEAVPSISERCVRAFRVPFEAVDGSIEVASMSDSVSLEIPAGKYSLQVEFLELAEEENPEVNIRFNRGEADFSILKADSEIVTEGDFDLTAWPAS